MAQASGDGALPPADPEPGSAMGGLERLSAVVNQGMGWAAGLTLAAMMTFSVVDMVLRAFGHTVAGSYEVIGWLSAGAMSLALGSVQKNRGHVAMELLVTRLGPRVRAAVELLTSVLSLLMFAAVAWYVALYGNVLQETGSLSETLRVVVYPWVYLVAIGCSGLTLALSVDVVRAAVKLLAVIQPRF